MPKLTATIETHQPTSLGWCLYDSTRGMNIAMHAESEQAAFVKAIEYYQRRTADLEKELHKLRTAVDSFVAQVSENPEDSL